MLMIDMGSVVGVLFRQLLWEGKTTQVKPLSQEEMFLKNASHVPETATN